MEFIGLYNFIIVVYFMLYIFFRYFNFSKKQLISVLIFSFFIDFTMFYTIKNNFGFSFWWSFENINIKFFLLPIIGFFTILYYFFYKTLQKSTPKILLTFLFILYILIIVVQDFVTFYVIIETANMTLYFILSEEFRKNNRHEIFRLETLLGYFMINLIGSLLMLIGFSFIYFSCGTLSFGEIALLTKPTVSGFELISGWGLPLGLITLVIGLCTKLGVAPFHIWVTPIYEAFPNYLFIFFQLFPKGCILLFTVLITSSFGGNHFYFMQKFFMIIAFLNIGWGTIGAFRQITLKRLLIYSGIANNGLIFYACLFNSSSINFNAILYLLLYIVTTASVLLPIFFVTSAKYSYWYVAYFTGNFQTKLRVFMTFAFLNLSGIPPFALFFGKLPIVLDLLDENFLLSSIFILTMSVVASAYSIGFSVIFWFQTDPLLFNKSMIKKDFNNYSDILAPIMFLTYIFIGSMETLIFISENYNFFNSTTEIIFFNFNIDIVFFYTFFIFFFFCFISSFFFEKLKINKNFNKFITF